MKIIFSLFFIACLIPAIFSATEQYLIEFEGDLKAIECTERKEDEVWYYGFQFSAIITGFPQEESFKILLEDPSYMFAQCEVPKAEGEEGIEGIIYCYILADQFPLLKQKQIKIPTLLTIFDQINTIRIENWVGATVDINDFCYLPFSYEFNQGANVPFNVTFQEDGTKILTSTGSFLTPENKKLTSSDGFLISPFAFVDSNYQIIQCHIYPANGGEDQIICAVNGEKKVVFFPTITQIDLLDNKGDYVKLDIYQEVSISKKEEEEDDGTSYASFVKLSSLLLLSLFLL